MQVWIGFKQNEEYVHEWTGEVAGEGDVGKAIGNALADYRSKRDKAIWGMSIQSPTAVKDAAPPEQRPSHCEGGRHCRALHRTQRVMRFAVNGFISSTTRAHVSALGVLNYKIYSRSRYLTHLRSIASQQTCHCIRRGIPACGCQENCDEGEDRGSRKEVGCQSAGYRGLRTETDETRRGKPRVCPNEHRPYPADSP